uniref:Uncharacterized protein n=1 Tax=Hucho hucho TaxID=62062 RepID=A0A4W5MQ48_9TELE
MKPCPLKPEVGLSLWDSAESDTESLVQERDYQLELQRRIGGESGDQNMTQPQEEDTDSSCLKEEDEGELHVYDSLEMCYLLKSLLKHIHYDDTYAELRYDPNWRTNLEGARQFDKMTPQRPLEEGSYNSDEQSEESQSERGQELSGSVGYRYIFARSPALVSPAFSYHLHQNQVIGDSFGTVAEKQLQNSMSSKSNGSRHLSCRKPDKPREDIIERNRVTLGINAAKQGSYLRAHAQQKVKSDSQNKVGLYGSKSKLVFGPWLHFIQEIKGRSHQISQSFGKR